MRLVFFCGSLEPGRDGVGDYTRRLAGECIRQGHACALVALNDPHVAEIKKCQQEIEGTSIPSLRLPEGVSWAMRMDVARPWITDFRPDWLSLQFVPFAFHPKGLCLGLGNALGAIKSSAHWHIMFHELWLGLGVGAPVKERIYGVMQRRGTLSLLERLRPRVIHTQAESYRWVLHREKISASILPLISNIPFAEGDAWSGTIEPLVKTGFDQKVNRSELYLAGVLGGVHPEWKAEIAVDTILPLVQRSRKLLVIVFLGKNNLSPEGFDRIKAEVRGKAAVVVVGQKTDAEISRVLQALDFGFATSPWQNIQKSGSAAAMLAHGLTVLVTRDDWKVRGAQIEMPPMRGLMLPHEFATLTELPQRDPNQNFGYPVKYVADQMLASMGAANRPA